MNIRANRPIQWDFELVFDVEGGRTRTETVRYSFDSVPSTFKVKMTARALARGFVATIPGLTLRSYWAVAA